MEEVKLYVERRKKRINKAIWADIQDIDYNLFGIENT